LLTQIVRARVLPFCHRFGTLLWLTFLLAFLTFFLRQHGPELRSAAGLVVRGNPRWAFVMVIMQLTSVALVTGKWRMLFRRLGSHLPAQTVLGAYLRRHLIGTVIPLGGPAGLIHFVRDLGKHRVSSGTVLHASMLASLVNQVAFVLYLVGALAWLAIAGQATGTVLIATIVVTALVIAAFISVSVLLKRAELPRFLTNRLPTRVLKPISEIRANGVRFHYIALALPFAIAVNVAGVALLAVALMVVGQHPAITTVLSARVASSISGLILPVMQGGGAVELTMVGALHAGGVPLPQAVAAMVVFRIVQFWIPISLGGLAMVPWNRRAEFSACLTPARLSLATGLLVAFLPLGAIVVAYYTFL
jgi:uncharacterized membrane protein YbhN (UPF0104 family)